MVTKLIFLFIRSINHLSISAHCAFETFTFTGNQKKMNRYLLLISLSLLSFFNFVPNRLNAQSQSNLIYRSTPEKAFNLIHTKLMVEFNIPESKMHGKVWLTLKPHFYSNNKLVLDAKGMIIHELSIVSGTTKKKADYQYDGLLLYINLDRTYTKDEKLIVYVDYTALPNELKSKGSSAIKDAKGLYFINPTKTDSTKPTQIWTQGETEATSVWCPTIDKPNQKSTQEFYIKVPSKWTSLSNGKIVSSKAHTDGTRTDYWKMDLPHAPYLFFIGAGEFSVVKDKWRDKEVNYYVEQEYASVARKIFGNTPEMMTFFSKITGIPYPWNKYSQIVCRDFVSGAMENTTATIHQEGAQQDARELTDGNNWEGTIAHELFHQWFGDYVTTESWSNLTLNESFANYSEYLWDEYKYGRDEADATHFKSLQAYLESGSEQKDLVRFFYENKEDLFDAVSYGKGGRILHMLRNYVGDSAFFKSIQLYLSTNQFKSAEAHQLRLAFEEITGKDLNWFFNQWYFGSGHPSLDIVYSYSEEKKQVKVLVTQTQKTKVFTLPVSIDIYHGATKKRHEIWIKNATDSFFFAAETKPDLINFDGDKMLLCTKKENKSIENYIHQYKYAKLYLDRREAIEHVAEYQPQSGSISFLKEALNDPHYELRIMALDLLNLKNEAVLNQAIEPIVKIAQNDPHKLPKAKAIELLGKLKSKKYQNLLFQSLNDSSYTVCGEALNAYEQLDPEGAYNMAVKLSREKIKGRLLEVVAQQIILNGDENNFKTACSLYKKMPLGQEKLNITFAFATLIGNTSQTEDVKEGIDAMLEFRNAIPERYGLNPVFDNFFKLIIGKKETIKKTNPNTGEWEIQINYIKQKLN